MTLLKKRTRLATLALAATAFAPKAISQTTLSPTWTQVQSPVAARSLPLEHQSSPLVALSSGTSLNAQPLFAFSDSDIKFKLPALMNILRDSRHEGWVLAAYPDPKTTRPLIGAGFSLDVPAREHIQRDPLNPTPFLEPSSAQLWQAAGLDEDRLQSILSQFNADLDTWQKKKFRRKIRTHELSPQLTEDEAASLLQISAIQAIHNAKAYCRDFEQLTASQQMALSQLVFQMGVNLEEFSQFLTAINNDSGYSNVPPIDNPVWETEHWKTVQNTLIQSDWARRYRNRAVNVIAMFDPSYDYDPWEAERRVRLAIHPIGGNHHSRRAATLRKVAASPHATHKKGSGHGTSQS